MNFDVNKESCSSPIIRPDNVKGVLGGSQRLPDRYFYIMHNESIWECDGYKVGDLWSILLICPICKQNLKIDSEKKPMCINELGLELAEPIRCSHPGDFGTACSFAVAIEPPKRNNQVHEVRCHDGVVRKVKIDAIARKV